MRISLKDAVGDFFETPEKWMTLLFLSLCQFIPLVGPVVMIGYFTRRFALTRSGSEAPDFKFEDFGDYLQIGLWPALAYFAMALFAMPLILLAELPVLMVMINLEPEPASFAPIIAAMALSYGLIILISLLLMFFGAPVVLRSSLMKRFQSGFSMGFVFDFIKKVGMSFFFWMVILWVISMVASVAGMLVLFVGAVLVSTLAMYAGFHLLYQHYELYLERGGQLIEVHPEVLRNVTGRPPLPVVKQQG